MKEPSPTGPCFGALDIGERAEPSGGVGGACRDLIDWLMVAVRWVRPKIELRCLVDGH